MALSPPEALSALPAPGCPAGPLGGAPFVFLCLILFGESTLHWGPRASQGKSSYPGYCSQVRIPVRLPEVKEHREGDSGSEGRGCTGILALICPQGPLPPNPPGCGPTQVPLFLAIYHHLRYLIPDLTCFWFSPLNVNSRRAGIFLFLLTGLPQAPKRAPDPRYFLSIVEGMREQLVLCNLLRFKL